MTVSAFRGPGLTEAQWEHISGLASSLDSKQRVWVSGFLAGIDYDEAANAWIDDIAATPGSAMSAGGTRKRNIVSDAARFDAYADRLSGADALRRLTSAGRAEECTAFARGHHVVDVIRQFPVRGIEAQHLIAGLRPLTPRLYSIASSLAVAPDDVHLTVSTVSYTLHGERRFGVASGHLAARGAHEHFGDFVIRAGYVKAVTAGRDFNS